MKLTTRDFVSTLLIVLVVVPYAGYLAFGEMPFVEDARGMAAVGLALGTVAYLVLSSGDPRGLTDSVESGVALAAFVLGFVAFALAETAAAEALLAAFIGAILIAWAIKMMDHAGVLFTGTPTHKV
jgi:NhaP-type Na+/H+ or K+/H+ antiporter